MAFIEEGYQLSQTKKGNKWKFDMKCHIGVDAGSGLVHTITVTAANIHDVTEIGTLLREDDEVVYGDSGYLGAEKRPEIANNEHFPGLSFVSTVVRTSCPIPVITRLIGSGILKIENHPCAAK